MITVIMGLFTIFEVSSHFFGDELRGAQLKSHGGPKNKKLTYQLQGPKLIGCNTFKECFYHRKKQNKQNLGLCGPE